MRQEKPQLNIAKLNPEAKIAIITAKWNAEYNSLMQQAAVAALQEAGLSLANIKILEAPGAFEIPLLALHLADTDEYDAIICFATIIRGATYHFDIVANESARGIMSVSLETGVPVLNGILAVENESQAEERAAPDKENKGREVALSALSLINSMSELEDSHLD